MPTLCLEQISVSQAPGAVRLNARFSGDTDAFGRELWFEFPDWCGDALVTDRADGVLLALAALCARHGVWLQSRAPASPDLLENLEGLMALLHSREPDVFAEIPVEAPVQPLPLPAGDWVVASGSCGVDAMHTLLVTGRSAHGRRPTHLLFGNTGSNEEAGHAATLVSERRAHTEEFCRRHGYRLLYVDSNFRCFCGERFYRYHYFVNCAMVYLLARKVHTYYYSPCGGHLDTLDFREDPALAEMALIRYLTTDSLHVRHAAGDCVSRFEKLRALKDYVPARESLNVCYDTARNCRRCAKCRRTLMELEVLGAVEQFGESFDLAKYRQERDAIFADLILDYWNGDPFVRDVWPEFRRLLTFRQWRLAYSRRFVAWLRRRRGGVWLTRHLSIE